MLLRLVAIIISIKIKIPFLSQAAALRKGGRFQYLLTEEEGFVSLGSSLVQPHGLHSFFLLHWGVSCSELAAAFQSRGTELGKIPPVSVQACPFPVALWHQGSVQVILLPRGDLVCHLLPAVPFLSGRTGDVPCPGRAWGSLARALPACNALSSPSLIQTPNTSAHSSQMRALGSRDAAELLQV